MADVKALAEELVNLSVKDVQELAKVLKEEYGIEPAAAAVVAAAPGAGAAAAAPVLPSGVPEQAGRDCVLQAPDEGQHHEDHRFADREAQ